MWLADRADAAAGVSQGESELASGAGSSHCRDEFTQPAPCTAHV